jgi:lactate permease
VARNSDKKADVKKLLASGANYIILLCLVLATRLPDIRLLKELPFLVRVPLGAHSVAIDWLTTPGTLLLVSALAGGIIQRARIRDMLALFLDAASKIKYSALTIVSIVALAKVMGYSGMIGSVAVVLGAATGKLYPLIAPALGALGTFVTGSDTSSNILLGGLQKETAHALGISPEWITAANTSGATAGKMISPLSISVAASSVGITDKEGAIMKKTLPYCILYVLALGAYVFVVSVFL